MYRQNLTFQENRAAPQSTDKTHRPLPEILDSAGYPSCCMAALHRLSVDTTTCRGEYRLRCTNIPFAGETQTRIDVRPTLGQHALTLRTADWGSFAASETSLDLTQVSL